MFEVEYKTAVPDLVAVRDRLSEHGAEPLGRSVEEDRYYQHPQRDFSHTDEALRVRTREGHRVLTYKGPRQAGPTRSREEVEVALDGDIDRVLVALGFRLAGAVHKTRETHRLNGLTITLDDVDGLGVYVEIEGLADTPEEVGCVREAVLSLVNQLGLGKEETRSYLEMRLDQPPGS